MSTMRYVLFSIVGILAATRATGQAPVTAFTHTAILPMDREQILYDQTVLVQGRRIVKMGPSGAVRVPANAVIVEARGKFLMPGLADMHMHLDFSAGAEADTLDEAVLMLYVANGITTIRNMHGRPGHLALRDRAAKGELVSPRIYTAGPMLESPEDLGTPEAAKLVVAEQKAAGYDFIKLHYDHGEIGLNRAAFDTFASAAHRASIPFAGHTPTLGLEWMLRAHPASIEHLSQYYMYLVAQDTATKNWYADYDGFLALVPDEAKIAAIAKLTKEAGVWNCPTLLITKTGKKDREKGPEGKIIDARNRLVKALYDAGAGLLLGTDGGPLGIFNHPLIKSEEKVAVASEIPEELKLLVKAGLTPYQALEMATRNPAIFLNTIDSTGTVAVGKRADLVLLNGNPMENPDQTRRPIGTMLGGRWFPR